jgi:quinoprotein dehydrogenase-associated probable ABC transporter substrate-binding protein
VLPIAFVLLACAFVLNAAETNRVLRITADPNNLPFSNDKLEGFENRIADLLARELNARIEYTWRAQRRGFFRETLKENNADLILGVPTQFERALTTKPYYRSAYAFVTRKDRALNIRSLDDEKLRSLRIGVHLIGDDGANTPPAHVLAARGIVTNVVGFSIYGDYSEANPPARLIEAVARGDIDVAIAWGPLAGYFAKQQKVVLEVTPVPSQFDTPALPFAFDISLGVRKRDKELRDELNAVLTRRKTDIEKILGDYGVPRVAAPQLSRAEGGGK